MTACGEHDRAVTGGSAGHGLFLLVLAAATAVLAAGCGPKDFTAIRAGLSERGHYIEGVPFYRQAEFDCGPAALAGVLSFLGKSVDLDRITAAVYLPKLKGTLPMDLERYARDAGFTTESSSANADVLRSWIQRGVPVICLLDLGFGPYRQPHYVTVIGFDDGNRLFIMHDGRTPNRTLSYDSFEKDWTRGGHWMLVVTPGTPKR